LSDTRHRAPSGEGGHAHNSIKCSRCNQVLTSKCLVQRCYEISEQTKCKNCGKELTTKCLLANCTKWPWSDFDLKTNSSGVPFSRKAYLQTKRPVTECWAWTLCTKKKTWFQRWQVIFLFLRTQGSAALKRLCWQIHQKKRWFSWNQDDE